MSTILNARKPLVIIGKQLTQADYFALAVLLDIMTKKTSKVEIAPLAELNSGMASSAKLPDLKKVTKLPPRKYILSFDRADTSVKNIQWQQNDKNISFHISMEKGEFKPQGLDLKVEGADYDHFIYFKVTSFDEVKSLLQDYPAFATEVKHTSVGGKFTIEHTRVELVDHSDANTIGEQVYLELRGQGLNAEHNTKLLTSILLATSRFKSNVTGAKTFARVAELINGGASLESANKVQSEPNKTEPAKPAEGTKPADTTKSAADQTKPQTANTTSQSDQTKPTQPNTAPANQANTQNNN